MSLFEDMQKDVAKKIQEITMNNIKKLSEVWIATFDADVCEEHLLKLCEHVSIFYGEVMAETVQRRGRIQSDVDKLHEEASTLCRLLKVDIQLDSQNGVPLYTVQQNLDNSLQELRKKLKQRKNEIYQLILEQDSLCDELGETPRTLDEDPLPTELELHDFRQHLAVLKDEKRKRLALITELRCEIQGYLSDLELSLESDAESSLLTDQHIPLTMIALNQLHEMRDQYRKQVEEVRNSIEAMKTKLKDLWNRLETSPSIRKKFDRYNDYSQTTYDKFYRELNRCEMQKRQNIKRFVDRIRDEILIWWDKTLKSDLEKLRFSNFTNDCYTEDLLTLHEMELDDLKRYYDNNETIFKLIEERQVLWNRMIALESKALEPGRFNNRGGQLLKEEKERKTIASKLPKIEKELTDLVHKYESVHNRKFLKYGEDIIEAIARDWEEKKVEKEKLMSARKNANLSSTPLSKTVLRTPLSARNHTTLKKTPSSTNVAGLPTTVKRKLTHTSTLLPNAKRSLMYDLASPLIASKTPFKSPARKNRIIATTIRRKSTRGSGNGVKSRKRSNNKTPAKIPKIIVTNENTLASDTMTYDIFEENIEKDPSSRSSVIAGKCIKKVKRSARNQQLTAFSGIPSHSIRLPVGSPSAGSSRKLTTKNLPILI